MAESEEVQGVGIEKRGRSEYYGYDTVVEEHPDWHEDKCVEHWQMLVAKSRDKITDASGAVFIAKARKILIDEVDNNMHYKRLKSSSNIGDADDLKDAVKEMEESQERFKLNMRESLPERHSNIPQEAKMVSAIVGNRTDSLNTCLLKNALQQSIQHDLLQKAIAEAKEEVEIQQEVQEDQDRLKAAKAAQTAAKGTPEGAKRLCSSLKTLLIEKNAKLEASIVRLRAECVAPDVPMEYLSEAERKATEAELQTLEDEAKKELDLYVQAVKNFEAANSLEKLTHNGKIADYEALVERILKDFKGFWGKEGKSKPFRLAMKQWKALAAKLEKDQKAWERASTKKSAARSKLNRREETSPDLPDIIDSLSKAIKDGKFQEINCSPEVDQFGTKIWKRVGCTDVNDALLAASGMNTQLKWMQTSLTKDGEDRMYSEISNKKLHGDVHKALSGVGPRFAREDKRFFLKFPAANEELKKVVTDYQIQMMLPETCSMNVTPFCLPEVVVPLRGEWYVAGLAFDAIDGDSMQTKIENMSSMDWKSFADKAAALGFAVKASSGDMIAIPAGMLVASFAPKADITPVGVRWSVMDKQDYHKVHQGLSQMLQSYFYLEHTDYSVLKKLLEATADPGEH